LKVDPRALAGIDTKVARASEHLTALNDEMVAWDTRRPWRLSHHVHDEGREHLWRLRFDEPIPIEWSVILGEIVHNLRSALDQSVYWLGVDWTGKEVAGSSFPVYTRKATFAQRKKKSKTEWSSTSGMYKIRGIGPGPHAFIEALQPYPQRYGHRRDCLALRLLHDFWNQDKHRLVHLWGLRVTDDTLELPVEIADDCVFGIDRRMRHEGAIVMKMTSDPPHPEVEMSGELTAFLSIQAGTQAGGPSISLLEMLRITARIVRKLTDALGHQADPMGLPSTV
jgi:hypothetical protein